MTNSKIIEGLKALRTITKFCPNCGIRMIESENKNNG